MISALPNTARRRIRTVVCRLFPLRPGILMTYRFCAYFYAWPAGSNIMEGADICHKMSGSKMDADRGDLTKYTVTVTDKSNTVLTDEALKNTIIEDESFYYILSVIDRRLQM